MNLGEAEGQEEAQFCGKRFVMKHHLYFVIWTENFLMPTTLLCAQLGAFQQLQGLCGGKANNFNLLSCYFFVAWESCGMKDEMGVCCLVKREAALWCL